MLKRSTRSQKANGDKSSCERKHGYNLRKRKYCFDSADKDLDEELIDTSALYNTDDEKVDEATDDSIQSARTHTKRTAATGRTSEDLLQDETFKYGEFIWYPVILERKSIPRPLCDMMKKNIFLMMQRDPRCTQELIFMVVPHNHPAAKDLSKCQKLKDHSRPDAMWSLWVFFSDSNDRTWRTDCVIDELVFPTNMLSVLDSIPNWVCDTAVESWSDLRELLKVVTSDYATAMTIDVFPPFIRGAYIGFPEDKSHWFMAGRKKASL